MIFSRYQIFLSFSFIYSFFLIISDEERSSNSEFPQPDAPAPRSLPPRPLLPLSFTFLDVNTFTRLTAYAEFYRQRTIPFYKTDNQSARYTNICTKNRL